MLNLGRAPSGNPGEGKSTVASNLALALAEIGNSVFKQSVLLVDGDLRTPRLQPRLHELFGVSNRWGLGDLLEGKTPPSDCEGMVFKTGFPNLYLLPSGSSTVNTTALLHSPRTREYFNRMRNEFLAVIIDTPPMLHMPDARILARLADGVILVVRSGKSMREAAVSANQRLTDDGANVLGILLNNWDPGKTNDYNYGYGSNSHLRGETAKKGTDSQPWKWMSASGDYFPSDHPQAIPAANSAAEVSRVSPASTARPMAVSAQTLAQGKALPAAPPTPSKIGAVIAERKEQGGVAAGSATAEPELLTTTVVANLHPTKSEKQRDVPASARTTDSISELLVSTASNAATESINTVREAAFRSSAAKQQSPAKPSQKVQFAAGLAVGCLALAAIGGGLVATGKLRLNRSSVIRSEGSDSNSLQAGGSVIGTHRSTIKTPPVMSAAEATAGPVRQQPEETRTSLPLAPTKSQAAAYGQTVQQRSVAKSARTSPSHPVDLSGNVPIAMNEPSAQTSATLDRNAVQAPSISKGTAVPQPESDTHTLALVAQPAAPTVQPAAPAVQVSPVPVAQSVAASAEARPAAQPEAVNQPRESRPEVVSQASAPPLRSPNPEAGRLANIESAKLLQQLQPVYPQEARIGNVQGSVEVLATIGKDGVPRALRTTRGDPRLGAAAMAAISRWRYKPAMLNGEPQESLITITVNFKP